MKCYICFHEITKFLHCHYIYICTWEINTLIFFLNNTIKKKPKCEIKVDARVLLIVRQLFLDEFY